MEPNILEFLFVDYRFRKKNATKWNLDVSIFYENNMNNMFSTVYINSSNFATNRRAQKGKFILKVGRLCSTWHICAPNGKSVLNVAHSWSKWHIYAQNDKLVLGDKYFYKN